MLWHGEPWCQTWRRWQSFWIQEQVTVARRPTWLGHRLARWWHLTQCRSYSACSHCTQHIHTAYSKLSYQQWTCHMPSHIHTMANLHLQLYCSNWHAYKMTMRKQTWTGWQGTEHVLTVALTSTDKMKMTLNILKKQKSRKKVLCQHKSTKTSS